jgi:nitrogen fixation NifU-like protein
MYSEKLLEHFKNPRNVGVIEDADGVGEAGNPKCGDMMTVYIKVKDDVIEDIKFQTFGCAAAIATSSMMTELAKGKKIEEALKISKRDIADALDGLPPIKMHCSLLAEDALKKAIEDYLNKKKNK